MYQLDPIDGRELHLGNIWDQVSLSSQAKFHIIFSIVYLTFWILGPRIYALQPNGDHHKNHKEILNKTGGGDFSEKFWNFLCIGSLDFTF